MNRIARRAALLGGLLALTQLLACSKSKVDEEETSSRILPVAKVELASATPADASGAAAAPRTGEQLVQQICSACHGTGAAGSPKIGDKAAWAPRIAQGKEALYTSALNGKNAMPARGGNPSLSDAEVKSAVDYLVAQAK